MHVLYCIVFFCAFRYAFLPCSIIQDVLPSLENIEIITRHHVGRKSYISVEAQLRCRSKQSDSGSSVD